VIPAQSKGCGSGVVKVRGDAQDEPLVDHDAVGVAAVGDASQVLVGKLVSKGRIRAELLEARQVLRAGAIGVHHAADGSTVAGLELGHRRADLGYAADDFVPRNTWIDGGHEFAPLVADRLEIGVTNAAIQNFDLYVVFGWVAPRDCVGDQRRRRTGSGVSFRVVHVLNVDARLALRYAEYAKLHAEYAKLLRGLSSTLLLPVLQSSATMLENPRLRREA
jgi:hypothetical protein